MIELAVSLYAIVVIRRPISNFTCAIYGKRRSDVLMSSVLWVGKAVVNKAGASKTVIMSMVLVGM